MRRGCSRIAPAVRLHEPPFTGTPMPKDEPLAPNPPLGAMIDYSLAGAASNPVEIAIYAPDGELGGPLQQHRSGQAARPVDPDGGARMGRRAETPPSATPGHHRFVWDLHYAKPVGLKDDDRPDRRVGAAGPLYRRADRRRPEAAAAADRRRRSAGQGQPGRFRRRVPARRGRSSRRGCASARCSSRRTT